MEYTPGPWAYDADINLICAAPDLLEALEKLFGQMKDIKDFSHVDALVARKETFAKGLAAIAKARGESP